MPWLKRLPAVNVHLIPHVVVVCQDSLYLVFFLLRLGRWHPRDVDFTRGINPDCQASTRCVVLDHKQDLVPYFEAVTGLELECEHRAVPLYVHAGEGFRLFWRHAAQDAFVFGGVGVLQPLCDR